MLLIFIIILSVYFCHYLFIFFLYSPYLINLSNSDSQTKQAPISSTSTNPSIHFSSTHKRWPPPSIHQSISVDPQTLISATNQQIINTNPLIHKPLALICMRWCVKFTIVLYLSVGLSMWVCLSVTEENNKIQSYSNYLPNYYNKCVNIHIYKMTTTLNQLEEVLMILVEAEYFNTIFGCGMLCGLDA